MKPHSVLRFEVIEIVWHWVQAVPYLVLIVTGMLMLAQRFLGAEWVPHASLSLLHRAAGLVLIGLLAVTLVVAMATGWSRHLRRTLRDAFVWRWHDIVWLVKVPLHALLPRVGLPPSGRLNPGQKLHTLVIATVVPGFVATGLAIVLVPSALGPWMIHAALLVPAGVYLGLHLFLTIVNPPTRQGLGGMFFGHVSAEYAAAHHPLWVGQAESAAVRHSLVSRGVLVGVVVALGAALAAGVWLYGPGRLMQRAEDVWSRGGMEVFQPGALCASHARHPGAGRCFACHRLFGPAPSEACLACHEEIQQAASGRSGVHGKLAGECRMCHADHAGEGADIRTFDREAFNHKRARYPLDGKHQDLPCDACHLQPADGPAAQRMRYMDLPFAACTDCHADPHGNPKATDCVRCHTFQGWKGRQVLFDHARDSRYPLTGKHAEAPCAACHRRAAAGVAATERPFRLYDIGAECADCHKDPHAPTLGADCRRCHTENAWRGRDNLGFDHNRDSRFRLIGKHAAESCSKCHVPKPGEGPASAAFKGLDTRCEACHPNPHPKGLEGDCTRCHTESGWLGRHLVFDHTRDSKYPLTGGHAGVACTKCHVSQDQRLAGARLSGTNTRCAACHKDPHAGQFEKTCEQCHGVEGWKGSPVKFSHNRDSAFAIDAVHAGLACDACHPAGKAVAYRPRPKTCEGCHTRADEAVRGTAAAPPSPDLHAGRVACTECHPASTPRRSLGDYVADCSRCHNPRYAGLLYDWAKSLHDREGRAAAILEGLRSRNDPRAADLARRIAEARAVGLHNVQLARRLWDEAIGTPTEESGAGRNPPALGARP